MSNLLCLNCGSYVGTLNDDPTRDCGCGNKTEFLNVPDSLAMHEKTRKIFFLIGPTGAGKNFVTGKLKDLGFENVPSVTTRGPREGEIPGEDYVYISTEAMERLKDSNLLCEYIKYGSGEYGVSREILLHKLWLGDKNLIIIVEPNGYKQILNWFVSNPRFIVPLNITLSSVFLDIPRSERFLNMLKDTSKINFYYSMRQALENIIMTDRNNLGLDEQKDIDLFIGHLDNILNRLVRNGDNISNEFKLANGDIQELIKQLALENITVSSHILTSKENVNEFILSKKNEKYNLTNLVEDIKKIEDAEILYKLFELVKNKITSKEK